jgi:hypothetical protein
MDYTSNWDMGIETSDDNYFIRPCSIEEIEFDVDYFKKLKNKGIKYCFLIDESDAVTGVNGLS